MLIPSTSYVEFWKFPFESLDQDARFQQKKELKIVARVPLFGAHGAGAGMEAQEKKGCESHCFIQVAEAVGGIGFGACFFLLVLISHCQPFDSYFPCVANLFDVG